MNRRDWVLAAGATLWTVDGVAKTRDASDVRNDRVLTHVRMRAHPDGRPTHTWYRGTFYGQRSGMRTQALLFIEGASTSTTMRQPDGSWKYQMREAGWFCDLQTHQVLNEWRNPLNDRVVKPAHYNSKQQLTFAPDGRVTPLTATPPPGLEWQGTLSEPTIVGNDVWSAEELLVRVPPPPAGGNARLQTSLATLHSDLRDLQKPLRAWVPSTLAYQTLGSWQAWLEMGDATGVVSWRLSGRKCATVDGIPESIRTRIQREHPEVFQIDATSGMP
jgi:hypothetical protein